MRHLIVALLSSILLLSSCLNKRPDHILSEKKAVELLTEVHLLDGYLQILPIDSAKKVMDTLYHQLFAKYGIDSVTFAKNVGYYYADPLKTERMYEKIHTNISSYEKEFNRADSIRYARERDSTQVAMHYQTLLNRQRGLWNFHPDTTYVLDYQRYTQLVHQPSGLDFLWQQPAGYIPPPSPQPATSPEVLTRPIRRPIRETQQGRPLEVQTEVVEEVKKTEN